MLRDLNAHVGIELALKHALHTEMGGAASVVFICESTEHGLSASPRTRLLSHARLFTFLSLPFPPPTGKR